MVARNEIKLSEVYAGVSRRARQAKDEIDVIDTQVVLAAFFDYLRDLDSRSAISVMSKGIGQAQKRQTRAKARARARGA